MSSHSVGLLHELGLTIMSHVVPKSNILVLVRREKVLHVWDFVTLRSERWWLEIHTLTLKLVSSLEWVSSLIKTSLSLLSGVHLSLVLRKKN